MSKRFIERMTNLNNPFLKLQRFVEPKMMLITLIKQQNKEISQIIHRLKEQRSTLFKNKEVDDGSKKQTLLNEYKLMFFCNHLIYNALRNVDLNKVAQNVSGAQRRKLLMRMQSLAIGERAQPAAIALKAFLDEKYEQSIDNSMEPQPKTKKSRLLHSFIHIFNVFR